MLFQENDIKFESLDSVAFEELCFDLLARFGFHALVWRQGGADSGRDIEASYTVAHPLAKHYDDRWFVECKLYKVGVPVEELASKVAWAEAEKPAHFLIITSSYLSNNTRIWLEKRTASAPFKTHVIEGKQLKQMLLGFGDLVERYFITRYVKLLSEAAQNWILHQLLPDRETLYILFEHLNPASLTTGEIAFLWSAFLFRKSDIEEWEESNEVSFPSLPLYELLTSSAQDTPMLAAEFRRITLGRGTVHVSLVKSIDFGAEYYVTEGLLSDSDKGPYLVFYSFYAPRSGPGLEVVVEGTLSLEARIRLIKSDVGTEFKIAQNILRQHGGL
jgi:hypothetical protein